MDVNTLIAQAKAGTENLEDQTKVSEGGFEFETAPAGYTPARFVGYVEVGKRKQKPYQGKPKPDTEEVRLYFELNGEKHQREVEVDGVKKTFTNIISVKVAKKLNDKAGFTKLFKKMLYGRDSITHMAQLLGEGFLIQIVHNKVPGVDGKPERTFANMKDDDGNWLIQAPSYTDPLTNESKPVPVPAPSQPVKLLLWDNPSKEQWESIFIDGTRTVKGEDGTEKEVSKNWLQEDIVQNAVNIEGSALMAMLGGVADLDLSPEAPAGEPEAPATPGAPAEPEKATDEAPTAPAGGAGDIMADLGL